MRLEERRTIAIALVAGAMGAVLVLPAVHAAARGDFDKSVDQLAAHETALIAAFAGDSGTDPWCDADAARAMRNRILDRMRNNGVISDTQFQDAVALTLELVSPPAASSCR